jgi:hypothetical protein
MSLVLGLTADLRDGRLPCAPAALLEANFPIPLGSFSSPRSSPGCSGMHPPFQAQSLRLWTHSLHPGQDSSQDTKLDQPETGKRPFGVDTPATGKCWRE